ncbi:MAG TPA: Crp/Fnr family transcriptional regulator [Noviherbaspirillum sp.]|uniref:Crp/Fnr family transcriptional regulator n=1 Tax=Noviherbaspirillum sp. TaxID=1926288 RepID=UPI002D2A429D|nr:Crp/Fnr family transcriptional regulator [Noviherbaspirillum sp.]HYD95305.1 Crp/Fnr family transcriptional regulator [Noviherbaspirillum sp.]
MSVTLIEARGCANHLLARLSDKDFEPLCSQLVLVHTAQKQVLHERNGPIRFVYFPCSCAMSNMIFFEDGTAVEVGTVGNEGVSGIELLARASVATETSICQVEGKSLRMEAGEFAKAIDGRTPLRRVSECYLQGYLSQVSQSVACNRKHSLEARFARWLLVTHDRVLGNEFCLTQEFLGDMLGVQRPSVSLVAAEFQKEGLIQYARGHIKILDRERLEATSCECYAAVRAQFKRVLGLSYG